jgi:hypothetical protein
MFIIANSLFANFNIYTVQVALSQLTLPQNVVIFIDLHLLHSFTNMYLYIHIHICS